MECQDPGESHAVYQVKLVNECILIALRCYEQSCLESFIQMASGPLSGWLRSRMIMPVLHVHEGNCFRARKHCKNSRTRSHSKVTS